MYLDAPPMIMGVKTKANTPISPAMVREADFRTLKEEVNET